MTLIELEKKMRDLVEHHPRRYTSISRDTLIEWADVIQTERLKSALIKLDLTLQKHGF